jgi:propanol-preferring alcohol dehydrogenase
MVEKIGERASRFRVGAHVGIAWLHSTCGVCEYCHAGRENLCKSIKFTGYDVNGGYAQFAKVNSGFALKLPKTFDDEHAAPLLCAGIIGYRAFKLSGAGRGSKLAMFGFGGAANITIQVAKYMGCRVFVFTRNKAHKKSAKKLGAAWVGGPDSVPKEKYDAAIIFAPAGELVVKALKHLERGGKVIIADIHMSKIPEIDYNDLYFEKSIASVANYTRKDADEFLALAEKIQIITHVTEFGLEDANKALLELKESKINGSAVLNITNNK